MEGREKGRDGRSGILRWLQLERARSGGGGGAGELVPRALSHLAVRGAITHPHHPLTAAPSFHPSPHSLPPPLLAYLPIHTPQETAQKVRPSVTGAVVMRQWGGVWCLMWQGHTARGGLSGG